MKKFLALILALCMCFSLVACADNPPADDTSTPDTTITDTTDPSED